MNEIAHLGYLSKIVCHECVGEEFLSNLINNGCGLSTCSYCEVGKPCIPIAELANHVERAIGEHYARTSPEPDDSESAWVRYSDFDYDWERAGEPIKDVVTDLLDCDEAIVIDVLTLLSKRHDTYAPGDPDEGENEFSATSHYEEMAPSLYRWSMMWNRLEEGLKHEGRFFNQSVHDVLRSVFANLDQARSYQHGLAIVTIGPGTALTALHRAREFQSMDELQAALKNPVEELGPPPARLAKANRMNASGISVFYGAEDSHSALAEVRPVVGSNVAVAKFAIVRPLKLLDLRALETVNCPGSLFDPNFAEECERVGFLRTLTKRLTVPVMPSQQDREYLTTQAVADYLAGLEQPAIDGILFPSVQDGTGVNVVLFHKASLVEKLEVLRNGRIEASLTECDQDSGVEYPSYSIGIVERQEKKTDTQTSDRISSLFSSATLRIPALRLELDSIEIHQINAVRIIADCHKVSLYKGGYLASHHSEEPATDF
ncbi:RES domain-containing protein [Pseudomonas azerbaijanoccidentalis]